MRSPRASEISDLARLDADSNPFPWSENALASAHNAARVEFRVITREEESIGYLVYQRVDEQAELQHIVVFSRWQGQGVGRRALELLQRELGKLGVAELLLEVRASNTAARRLYLTLGFVETGRRAHYYRALHGREDAVLMRLELAPAGGERSQARN